MRESKKVEKRNAKLKEEIKEQREETEKQWKLKENYRRILNQKRRSMQALQTAITIKQRKWKSIEKQLQEIPELKRQLIATQLEVISMNELSKRRAPEPPVKLRDEVGGSQ